MIYKGDEAYKALYTLYAKVYMHRSCKRLGQSEGIDVGLLIKGKTTCNHMPPSLRLAA